MIISDEKLSAFLDAELPESDMQTIREALATDDSLSDRLAELALVDTVVATAYKTIDEQPLPESITALLQQEPKSGVAIAAQPIADNKATTNIVSLAVWRRFSGQAPTAIAASIALVFGIGLGHLLPGAEQDSWQQISAALDNSPSGVEQQLSGARLKPRLSYVNQTGAYCRQFQLVRGQRTEQSIACREQNGWQLQATILETKSNSSREYQTASGHSAIDSILDQTLAKGPFDQEQEAAAIKSGWQKQ